MTDALIGVVGFRLFLQARGRYEKNYFIRDFGVRGLRLGS